MAAFNHALIMAAGRGQRMMPLTESIPKAMASADGLNSLIANGIEKIKKHIPNVHITVGYKKAMLAEHVIQKDISSIINTESKGNAWWIYNSLLKFLNEPVLVLTCDNIMELDFDLLYKNYVHHKQPPCMVIPVEPVHGLEGDFIFQMENRVIELSRTKPSPIYCSGIQIVNPFRINAITKQVDDFSSLWEQLIHQKLLYCSDVYPSKWFTVDTIEQLERMKRNN